MDDVKIAFELTVDMLEHATDPDGAFTVLWNRGSKIKGRTPYRKPSTAHNIVTYGVKESFVSTLQRHEHKPGVYQSKVITFNLERLSINPSSGSARKTTSGSPETSYERQKVCEYRYNLASMVPMFSDEASLSKFRSDAVKVKLEPIKRGDGSNSTSPAGDAEQPLPTLCVILVARACKPGEVQDPSAAPTTLPPTSRVLSSGQRHASPVGSRAVVRGPSPQCGSSGYSTPNQRHSSPMHSSPASAPSHALLAQNAALRLQKADTDAKLTAALIRIKELEERLSGKTNNHGIDAEEVAKLRTNLSMATAHVESLTKGNTELKERVAVLSDETSSLEAQLLDAEARARDELVTKNNMISDLEAELDKANKSAAAIPSAAMEQTMAALTQRLQDKEHDHQIRVTELEEKLAATHASVKQLEVESRSLTEQLATQTAARNEETAVHKKEVARVKAEVSSLHDHHASTLSDIQSKLIVITDERDDALAWKSQLEVEKKELEKQVGNQRQLQEELALSEKNCIEAKSHAAQLHVELEVLKTEANKSVDLEQEVNDLKTQNIALQASLVAQKSQHKSEIDELHSTLEQQHAADVSKFEKENAELIDKLQDVESELTRSRDAESSVRAEKDQLSNQIKDLEHQQQEDKAAHDSAIKNLEHANNDLEHELQAAKKQILSLEAGLAATTAKYETEISVLREELETVTERSADTEAVLKQRLQDATAENDNLSSELETLKQDFDRFVAEANEKQVELGHELETVCLERDELRTKHDVLERDQSRTFTETGAEIIALKSEKDELELLLNGTESAYVELQNKHHHLTAEHEELSALFVSTEQALVEARERNSASGSINTRQIENLQIELSVSGLVQTVATPTASSSLPHVHIDVFHNTSQVAMLMLRALCLWSSPSSSSSSSSWRALLKSLCTSLPRTLGQTVDYLSTSSATVTTKDLTFWLSTICSVISYLVQHTCVDLSAESNDEVVNLDDDDVMDDDKFRTALFTILTRRLSLLLVKLLNGIAATHYHILHTSIVPAAIDAAVLPEKGVGALAQQQLTSYVAQVVKELDDQHVSPALRNVIIGHCFEAVDVTLGNAFLSRKELCCHHCGQNAKLLLSSLEQWTMKSKLPSALRRNLQHARQVCDVLMLPKEQIADDAVREAICPNLTTRQVFLILSCYHVDRNDGAGVPTAVLAKMQQQQGHGNANTQLLTIRPNVEEAVVLSTLRSNIRSDPILSYELHLDDILSDSVVEGLDSAGVIDAAMQPFLVPVLSVVEMMKENNDNDSDLIDPTVELVDCVVAPEAMSHQQHSEDVDVASSSMLEHETVEQPAVPFVTADNHDLEDEDAHDSDDDASEEEFDDKQHDEDER
eukprot:PhM_4_TR15345/c0_g1_i1/m.74226